MDAMINDALRDNAVQDSPSSTSVSISRPKRTQRVVMVSNRVSADSSLQSSPGGLAAAMQAALIGRRAMWFGWSGEVSDKPADSPKIIESDNITRAVINLSQSEYKSYYAGFSNRSLWPLFHYRLSITVFDHEDYAGYLDVNQQFARHLAPLLKPDDLIWIHDYHLIPLGASLRALGMKQRIGFFLHTPFPGPDVLTTLPPHADLMKALAAYDVVGFQTESDVHGFAEYITQEVHGKVWRDGRVEAFGRKFRIGAFPVGIDPEITTIRAKRALASPRGRTLRDSLNGRKLIMGVDRLDYSKGLVQRFKGVEQLLESHPEHRRGMVVLQIAPLSRDEVPEYRQVRSELNALIGHINGRFGEPDMLPVRYLNKNFGQYILFGFLRLAQVGLVTPLRDGMNLVAKEYIASQNPEDPGALVLSRFAGAAKQLDAALIVNPFDPVEISQALHRALTMPLEERKERYEAMMQVLRRHDIAAWRDNFLKALGNLAPAPALVRPPALARSKESRAA